MGVRTIDYIDGDTIAAIATPVGSGGIGIIRISGRQSSDIAKALFRKESTNLQKTDTDFLERLPSHQLTHGYIYDDHNQGLIDEVLIVVMRAPHSYTREDVVEIQSHCGPVILDKILRLVLRCGARMALPGEFTRRAFLNGRIDLVQAEAVGEMIAAKSESALRLALTQLTGRMKEILDTAIQRITDLQVELEAGLEFEDEVPDPVVDYEGMHVSLQEGLIKPVQKLLEHYKEGYRLRDGLRLGIVGRPNVGKSSLLNCMIRRDRAIVTPLPGTTRDLIEEFINIDGLPLVITDTAGLHATDDPVETIGIEKTRESLNHTDVVLFVVDAEEGFKKADEIAFEQIGAKKIIVVINKVDLVDDPGSIRIPPLFTTFGNVFISAKFGQGMEKLIQRIKELALGDVTIEPGRTVVPNLRQKICLENALEALFRAQEAIDARAGEEFVLVDLGQAKEALKEISGQQFDNDILDQLFSTFCIGK